MEASSQQQQSVRTTVAVVERENRMEGGKVTYALEELMRFRDGFTELPAAVRGPDTTWPSMEIVEKLPVQRGSRGGRGVGGKQTGDYDQERMKCWQKDSLNNTFAALHTPSGGGGRKDNFRGGMDNRWSNSVFSRSTMAPVYQSNSMGSRGRGPNRMTLPRAFHRDESMKTGPQGRPATFGYVRARRGGGPLMDTNAQPTPPASEALAASEASKTTTEAAASGKKAAIG